MFCSLQVIILKLHFQGLKNVFQNRAPSDCLQYYTGINGRVKSFNFASQVQIASLSYTACIRQEEGFCGIQWKATQGLASTLDAFDLSDDTTARTVN